MYNNITESITVPKMHGTLLSETFSTENVYRFGTLLSETFSTKFETMEWQYMAGENEQNSKHSTLFKQNKFFLFRLKKGVKFLFLRTYHKRNGTV